MRPYPAPTLRRSTAPFSALLSALALTPSWADTATGVFSDRNATLLSLDAAHLDDAMAGAHFAGTRVTSVLDAGVSTYYYSNGGRTDYWATRPGIPAIQVGAGTQSVTESYGASDSVVPVPAAVYPVPKAGGGTVGVSVAYSGNTQSSASLAQGILRASAENGLTGPGVAAFPTTPYEGYGAYGTAYARAEMADHLTASATTTLRLTGIWEGTLSSGTSSGISSVGSGVVLAVNPTTATAHMEIGIWSAPHGVIHPGDGESPGFSTTERSYLGGISLDQSVVYGQTAKVIHQPFDVSVVVPAGNFYFYASQSVATGGQTDPSQGTGGPVFADTVSSADFDHTLQFDLATSDGATLTSESGQFLTAVPEPGSWAVLSGLALAGWAVTRQRRDPRVAWTSTVPPR